MKIKHIILLYGRDHVDISQKEEMVEQIDTTKRLMSSPKCRSVEVINNPARPGSNHREVNYIIIIIIIIIMS
jgi:hypothetical protein